MFSSKNRDKDSAPQTMAAVPSAPQANSKRVQRSSAPSIISADLVVNGTLTSTGDIQIDGRVEGDVHSSGLVIGDKAHIQGEILADDVTVRGHVHGQHPRPQGSALRDQPCRRQHPARGVRGRSTAPSSKAIAVTRTIRWARS